MAESSGRERIERLPVWARDKIQLLQRRLEDATQRIEELEVAPESNTSYRVNMRSVYLPKNARITFKCGENKYREEITVNLENGHLYVSGLDTISVEPRARNVVLIYVGKEH